MKNDANLHGIILYDKRAKTYDREASLMERMLGSTRKILNVLQGNILEIGTGTGINLPFFNSKSIVTAIDWSNEMVKIAKWKKNLFQLSNIYKIQQGDAQELSAQFKSHSFDNIASTCVFCSIPDPILALKEVKKILKPNGYLIQIEHGLSRFWLVNILMNFFAPIIYHFTGTHINRNHVRNLKQVGFNIIHEKSIDPMGIMKIIISKSN